jgi:hypothetical protein
MTNPFEAEIKILLEAWDEAHLLALEDAERSVGAAIAVLEAAGKVDKVATSSIIRALLAALPDKETK